MIKKIIFILILLVTLSSCSSNNVTTESTLSLSEYGIDNSNLKISKISYDDFKDLNNDKVLNGLVFVIRKTCDYCPLTMQKFADVLGDREPTKDLYAVDSDEMTIEEKEDMIDKYGITSVPTLVIFKNGELKSIEVGNISQETMDEIIDFIT